MPVAALAAQRDEQIARRQRARVDRDAGGRERGVASGHPWPRAGRRVVHSGVVMHPLQPSAGITLDIVERDHRAADRLALLVALAGHRQHVAGPQRIQRRPRSPARGRRSPARRGSRAASRRGSMAGSSRARIVVGDDGHVGEPRRRRAHQRALARSRSPPAPNTTMQPARGVRTQRRQQPLQRVRRVGVIDIGRGAVRQPRRQFHPAAHAAQRRQPVQRVRLAQRARERRGQQGVVGLEPAGQRQARPRAPHRRRSDLQLLTVRPRAAPRPAGSHRRPSPTVRRSSRRRRAMSRSAARVVAVHVRVRHRRRAGGQQIGEQAQLGGAVGRLGAVIVQMVARQVGESRRGQSHAVQPELVQPVRGRLHRRVRDAGSGQPASVCGKATGSGVVRPGPARSPARSRPACPGWPPATPAAAQIWRRNSTVLVLPLVPVTATTIAGCAPGEQAASCARAARRGSGHPGSAAAAARRAARPCRCGASTAAAPRATASAMNARPSARAPGKRGEQAAPAAPRGCRPSRRPDPVLGQPPAANGGRCGTTCMRSAARNGGAPPRSARTGRGPCEAWRCRTRAVPRARHAARHVTSRGFGSARSAACSPARGRSGAGDGRARRPARLQRDAPPAASSAGSSSGGAGSSPSIGATRAITVADHRPRGPAAGGVPVRGRIGVRRVEHRVHEVARRVHRERRDHRAQVLVQLVAVRADLLRGAGLGAHQIARHLGRLAGALRSPPAASACASSPTSPAASPARRPAARRRRSASRVGGAEEAAVDDRVGAGHQLHRRDRDAVAERNRHHRGESASFAPAARSGGADSGKLDRRADEKAQLLQPCALAFRAHQHGDMRRADIRRIGEDLRDIEIMRVPVRSR